MKASETSFGILILFGLIVFLTSLSFISFAQENRILDHVEPPFWWVDMNHPQLQILMHGQNISELNIELKYPGVRLDSVQKVENDNYLFLHLSIAPETTPGNFTIYLKEGNKDKFSYVYELKSRKKGSSERKGFDNSDIIYLITPDRFSNGNTENDSSKNLSEKVKRSNKNSRHGGDISGIIDHLDYIQQMGFTAIWSNPLLENNMEEYSYHGYSTTDFYKIDERFGTNEDYVTLSSKTKSKGMKLIMDMIANHCGREHWWTEDLPTSDWYHHQNDSLKTITSHKRETLHDPYAAESERKKHSDGWFVQSMPDLNQQNLLLAEYLIQNSIWWVEYADLSGIRQDTYSYPDPKFMTQWSCRIMNEYPNFNIVGEEWSLDPVIVSSWQKDSKTNNQKSSCLPSVFDFPIQDALKNSLLKEDDSSLNDLYHTLAKDFLYNNPHNLVTFLDNHDMARFYNQMDENLDLFKMGLIYLYSVRGIPQIYYGTEILMNNTIDKNDHALIREDMPGGWSGDSVNAFTSAGLSNKQLEVQGFIKKLNIIRKENSALQSGFTTHYSPADNIYVLFRYDSESTFMCVFNKNQTSTTINTSRFQEILKNRNSLLDMLSGKEHSAEELVIKGNSASIFLVK